VPESDAAGRFHGCLSGVDNTICMRACSLYPAKREGYREICNELLNQVVYCCNVSCIALWASHIYSHRGIRRIRNVFIIVITGIWRIRNAFIIIIIMRADPFVLTYFRYPFHPCLTAAAREKSRSFCPKCKWQVTANDTCIPRTWLLHEVTWGMVVGCTQNASRRQQFHVAPAV